MADQPTEALSFPLAALLASVEPAARAAPAGVRLLGFAGGADAGRVPNEKEVEVLYESRKAGRVRSLLLRRATDDGRLLYGRLQNALKARREATEARLLEFGPAAPGPNWLSVGPRNINGRIKCLAIHPTDGNTLYAGAANGGVWKTTDGGHSWTPTMHDQASLAIGALAIDPNHPETVYAGTGEPVYLVQGGGPLPPGSANLGWYYEGVGVFKSTNGGVGWVLTGPLENHFIYRIAVDPFDAAHVLCAGYSLKTGTGGLCRSTNGGASWATVQQGVFTDVLFDPSHQGRAYAGKYRGGVLKTMDGGQNWSARNAGLAPAGSIGRVNLTLAQANSAILYAKLENEATGGFLGLYRTNNAAEPPAGWSQVGNPAVDTGYAWWCSHVEADPTDANGKVVWAGGVNLARSADGGMSWGLVTDAYNGTRPPTHADQHALVFHPTDPNVVYIANDGGVFRGHFTGGTPPVTWAKISAGLVVTQFYDLHASPPSPSMFGGGAQDNGSMVSTGGLSWRHVYGGDGGYVAFHPTDPYTLYVQYQGAQIQKSIDGANTFSPARAGIEGSGVFPATVLVLDPSNPDKLFCGTERIYRTLDGGGSWQAVSDLLDKVTQITIASPSVVYAGTLAGRLYLSTNGGDSFAEITPDLGTWPRRWLSGIAVAPNDPQAIYVTFLGFNGSVAHTSNHVWKGTRNPSSGAWNWVMRGGGIPDVPAGALAIDSTTADLYLGTDVGVYRSEDDGVTWVPLSPSLPNVPIVHLALDASRRLLRASTHGRGMYQIRLAGPYADVDLYVRDNLLDTGEMIPSPAEVPDPTRPGVLVRRDESPDIKIAAPPLLALEAMVDGVEFDDIVHPYTGFGNKIEDIAGIREGQPIRSQMNRVYVQVHNRGWAKADSVTVKLLWADADPSLSPLPADFWVAFPGDDFDQTRWKTIQTWSITDLLPNVPRVLGADWSIPASAAGRLCLLALVHSPQAPLVPETILDVGDLTMNRKQAAQRIVIPNVPVDG